MQREMLGNQGLLSATSRAHSEVCSQLLLGFKHLRLHEEYKGRVVGGSG